MKLTEPQAPEFSFIIPLYHTGAGLVPLLDAFRHLCISETWELVLVDDGSTDGTFIRARELTQHFPAPIVLVELARNYGEHAAVLEGMRRASGRFLVNLDDDLQNPLEEAVRLLRHLRDSGAEVVYSRYETKQHPWLRNLGSSLINRCATLVMQKPAELYLSSFRALHAELAARITSRSNPWPHIDGLILTATQHISTLTVRHEPRQHGSSQYSLRKLLRLASSVVFDSSILPLRAASVLGVLLFLAGGALLLSVAWQRLLHGTLPHGWDSLIGVVCLFCGAQFLMLGIVGEYLGRVWLTLAGKPQSHVRTVIPRTP